MRPPSSSSFFFFFFRRRPPGRSLDAEEARRRRRRRRAKRLQRPGRPSEPPRMPATRRPLSLRRERTNNAMAARAKAQRTRQMRRANAGREAGRGAPAARWGTHGSRADRIPSCGGVVGAAAAAAARAGQREETREALRVSEHIYSTRTAATSRAAPIRDPCLIIISLVS